GAGPSGADRSAHGASDSGPSDHGPAGAPARESVQTRAGSPAGLRTLDYGSGGGQTEVCALVVTPRYMSPEQAQGRAELLGLRSDPCALGWILFELVALVPAVPGTTAYGMLVAAAHGRRAPLQHWRTGKPVPRPPRAIIERPAALHPEPRYQRVRALA